MSNNHTSYVYFFDTKERLYMWIWLYYSVLYARHETCCMEYKFNIEIYEMGRFKSICEKLIKK